MRADFPTDFFMPEFGIATLLGSGVSRLRYDLLPEAVNRSPVRHHPPESTLLGPGRSPVGPAAVRLRHFYGLASGQEPDRFRHHRRACGNQHLPLEPAEIAYRVPLGGEVEREAALEQDRTAVQAVVHPVNRHTDLGDTRQQLVKRLTNFI